MAGVLYITFGVLYIFACVMDGRDIKPLWKKWLGTKIENVGQKLYKQEYCNRYLCEAHMAFIKNAHKNIVQTIYDSVLIESRYELSEYEVFRARYEEEQAKKNGLNPMMLPRFMSLSTKVEELKEQCVKDILKQARQFVEIDVQEEKYTGRIQVRGRMNVGKVRV